ncbi:MAG: hypothetical protein H6R19_737 [Proteobacteria bacterium]|nr:hypothetical protein [Pseudomonadota bacterium]
MNTSLPSSPVRHRSIFLRQLRARPRLFLSIGIALLVLQCLPQSLAPHLPTRLLLAWNAGACLYLLLAMAMVLRSSLERLHWRAMAQDEGRFVVLGGVILASVACLAAIFMQLAGIKDLQGPLKYEHIGLAALTIVSSWAFVHLMFAQHYAHGYYLDRLRGGPGGLLFPETAEPDYLDFVYFAAVIGTSGQTADVSFTSRHFRRIGLVHCVLAYAFNTTVLALTINIASGLL